MDNLRIISESLKDLLRKMMDKNPKTRITLKYFSIILKIFIYIFLIDK